jgi:pimeloyl-ACP methyl ester carboxylesterase
MVTVTRVRAPCFGITFTDFITGMPASASAKLTEKLVPHAEVKIYEKAAHGLYLTHADQVIKDIVGFVQAL